MGEGRSGRDLLPVWLSALVWPGAGQIYTGRMRKGGLLVALSTLLALAFATVYSVLVVRALPADPGLLGPDTLMRALWRPATTKSGTLLLAALPLGGVWLYAIVDAWRQRPPRGV